MKFRIVGLIGLVRFDGGQVALPLKNLIELDA